MNKLDNTAIAEKLRAALSQPKSSRRLQAALTAGTHPQDEVAEVLIERCAVEPDFYVRDTLSWALTRCPANVTVPRLIKEVAEGSPQARSQALHTLSKIGDPMGWTAINDGILRDTDDEIARAAWRAAIVLAPEDQRTHVAEILVDQLGRGERDVQLSLSRAIIALEQYATPALTYAMAHGSDKARAHAIATERMSRYPEEGFEAALHEAKRAMILGHLQPGDAHAD